MIKIPLLGAYCSYIYIYNIYEASYNKYIYGGHHIIYMYVYIHVHVDIFDILNICVATCVHIIHVCHILNTVPVHVHVCVYSRIDYSKHLRVSLGVSFVILF